MKKYQLISLEKGIGFISIASIFMALFGLFVKLGMEVSSIPLLVFLRFFLPLLILIPWIIYNGGREIFTSQSNLKDQTIRACFEVFVQFCLFHYLSKKSLLNGVMLWNTGPLFIPFISKIFFKHHVSKITCFSVLVGLIGVACIIKPTNGIMDAMSIYGLLAGLGMGCSQVIYGLTVHRYKITENLFYLYGITSFLSFIVLVVSSFFIPNEIYLAAKTYFFSGWTNIIYVILISICSIGSQSFRGVGYKYAKPVSLSPFLYLSVLIAGILDWVVFHRTPTFLSIIGSLLIIIASFLKWSYAVKREKAIQKK